MKVERVKTRIAGDMALSKDFSASLRKWRNIFKVSQVELADQLGISSSVISDYESGRRKSPGISTVRKLVDALVRIDVRKGMPTLKTLVRARDTMTDSIIEIKEFEKPISSSEFCKRIGAKELVSNDSRIYGYTVIDSKRAVVEMEPEEFLDFFGQFHKRALIFTGVRSGRSVLVAVKVGRAHLSSLKPELIVLHGPDAVDDIAVEIARSAGIGLATLKKDLETVSDKFR